MFGQITQLFDGDGGQDYRLQADTAFQNKNYLQWILLSTDGLLEYTLDIALVPTAIITSKIDTFSQETLGLGLAEMACNLQAHQLLKPAGEALYHFSNWARVTAAGIESSFVSTLTNVGVKSLNQAAGLVGINGNTYNNLVPNQGYSSFKNLKKSIGSAGRGNHWHHIVEQSQIEKSGFSPYQIHNTSNIIAVDKATHSQITGHYNKILNYTNGMTVRNWLAGQSFETQYNYGIDILKQYGVIK